MIFLYQNKKITRHAIYFSDFIYVSQQDKFAPSVPALVSNAPYAQSYANPLSTNNPTDTLSPVPLAYTIATTP
jgi:hypothetical protein